MTKLSTAKACADSPDALPDSGKSYHQNHFLCKMTSYLGYCTVFTCHFTATKFDKFYLYFIQKSESCGSNIRIH